MIKPQEAEAIWRTYTGAWSITEPTERNRVLSQVLARDVEYTDPLTQTAGRDELSQYMAGFQSQFPGGGFQLRTFRFRSNESIAEWAMVDESGASVSEGVSYGRYDNDGQLVKMAGFFSTAPG